MKTRVRLFLIAVLALGTAGLLTCLSGCGSSGGDQGLAVSVYLTGDALPYRSRDIKLLFNKAIDPATLADNIILSDSTGSLAGHYTLEMYGADADQETVLIRLNDDYDLNEAWLYTVRVTTGVRAATGETLPANTDLEIITSGASPLSGPELGGTMTRTKIVVISDIHLGEERAAAGHYCWFTENSALLEDFLDDILLSGDVKELVIAGDFFDEWVIPMAVDPYQSGVTSDEDYFLSVANAPLNRGIIAKMNAIANSGTVRLVYIPGNHDMLMTEAIMRRIIPNIVWRGQGSSADISAGNGDYWPTPTIAIEHGHRYDFFNSPDPLTKTGSLLPPGFFISRVFATKMQEGGPVTEASLSRALDIEFSAAWEIAIAAIGLSGLDKDALQIKTGLNGYTGLMSVNGVKANYTAHIGDQWGQRQTINNVYSHMAEWTAILAGSGVGWWGNLYEPAEFQYLIPHRVNIIAFGHSHKGMIKKAILDRARIYANSGTWVDKSQVSSGYNTRTFLVINPALGRGSGVDSAALYQYNGHGDLSLLDEQSLKAE